MAFTLLSRPGQGLVRPRSVVFSLTAGKFTAPTVKEAVKKKYQLDTINHPLPSRVNIPATEVRRMRSLNREAKEEEHQEDMFAFNKLLTLESQMESLKTKGFLRAYRDYSPPTDLNTRFLRCVSTALEKELTMDNMDSVEISDSRQKLKLLKSLASEFDHRVHNSRLHMMKTLGDVYLFYKVTAAEVKTSLMKYFQSPISSITPYDQLHEDSESGLLPANLVVQKNPIRFTGSGDHPLNTVSAFPRSNTVIHSKASKEKYKPYKAPYDYHQEEDYN